MWLSRNFIVFLLIAVLFCLPSLAQTKSELKKEIKKEFQLINNDSSFLQVRLENEEFLDHMPDGGGELIGFFQNGQIRKIYQWIGLSNGTDIREYYFKNGELIFVYNKFNSFVFDYEKEEFDLTKTETSFEGRYYFNKTKLIDHTLNGRIRSEELAKYPGKILQAEAMEYLNKLTGKKG